MAETSVVELLRAANREDMTSKPLKMEIKRMSKVLGAPFVMTLMPVSYKDWEAIVKSDGEYRSNLLAKAWVEAKSIDIDTLDKFGAADAAELLCNILNAGEIAKLAAEVEQISGFRDSIEELKKR